MTKKVLLTGISGFVGMQCAVELLKNGYAVRGSLRNVSKAPAIVSTISQEVEPNDNLEFCELDLLSDDGWDEAAEGCDYLMHVASPFSSKAQTDENELIKPAVQGTLRALNAAQRNGIQRVVLTSSMVAMLGDLEGDQNINQKSWTQTNAKNISAYLKSKTLAEKSAWEFVNKQTGDKKLELVTIHPGPIYGPTISGNLEGESMNSMKNILEGKVPRMLQASISMSDIRDVAKIHVLALENKQARNRRFIVASEQAHSYQELTKVLKSGGYNKVSTKVAPNFLIKLLAKFNNEMKGWLPYVGKTYRADISDTKRTFDWAPTPFNKMVLDTAKSIDRYINA